MLTGSMGLNLEYRRYSSAVNPHNPRKLDHATSLVFKNFPGRLLGKVRGQTGTVDLRLTVE